MERIQIDDFSQVKMLSQLQASPSGEKLAFVVTQAQVKANKYVSHIHLLENGKVRKLTSGGAEKSLYWLDEEHILFPGDRTGKYKAMRRRASITPCSTRSPPGAAKRGIFCPAFPRQ